MRVKCSTTLKFTGGESKHKVYIIIHFSNVINVVINKVLKYNHKIFEILIKCFLQVIYGHIVCQIQDSLS